MAFGHVKRPQVAPLARGVTPARAAGARPTALAAAVLLASALPLFAAARPPSPAAPGAELNQVLDHLDAAAARLHALSADVISTKFTKIVNDTALERGQIYFRRGKHGPQIVLDLQSPARREFLYRDQTGYLYQPGIRQVQVFNLQSHRQAVQKYLLLSFGGGGHALLRSFHIRLAGRAAIHGQPTVKLVLTPLHPAHANGITSIALWYSPRLWVALRQQVNQVSGDYQRLDYSRIRINPHLPSHLFSTYFPGATVIRPPA